MGTPSYMAPEQGAARGHPCRHARRCVRPGSNPVRMPDGPPAVCGGDGVGFVNAGGVGRAAVTAASPAEGAGRSGDDLSEMSRQGTCAAV